jgi:hypothetical protein
MGLKIMTKSKNRPTKWQFFHENHKLDKVVEMKGTDGSFVLGGIDGLKNQSGKCEGPGEGARRVKEPEWKMRRTGRGGVDKIKN